jgi:hypothetical protein
MKKIKDMSPQEISELVSYTTPAGTTIYYSGITHMSSSSIIYQEELLKELSPSVIELLKEGKANYEAYRIMMTPQEVSKYLSDQVDTLLANKVAEALDSVSGPLKQAVDQITKKVDSAYTEVSIMRNAVKSIESFMPATFSEDMKTKYETVHANLLQAKTDFNNVNNKLKTLLVIEE